MMPATVSVVSTSPTSRPPYRGTLWPRRLNLYFPRYLRRRTARVGSTRRGAEKLPRVDSTQGTACCHARTIVPDEDPLSLSAVAGKSARRSSSSPARTCSCRQAAGVFCTGGRGVSRSIREGMDKQAVQTSIEILETAERRW
jgi:hypothetical protein